MVGVILAGQGVQIYGTDHQKNLHLQSIIDATQLWCQLFSEPESGSDLGSLRTTAEPDGDGWVVNGQKSMVQWRPLQQLGNTYGPNRPKSAKASRDQFLPNRYAERWNRNTAIAPNDR